MPTVHLNVRYFEIAAPDGTALDAWFGGGTDLTPTYPYPEDAVHFHRTLKAIADRHHPSFHPRFKAWCDNYFVNLHRGEERRGVGGIFFDHLRAGDSGLDGDRLLEFVADVGRALPAAYGPIVERRQERAVRRARAPVPAGSPGALRRVQPGARPGHAVRTADQRPDRERADEPAAAGRLGVRAELRAGLVRGRAAGDAGAAGLGGGRASDRGRAEPHASRRGVRGADPAGARGGRRSPRSRRSWSGTRRPTCPPAAVEGRSEQLALVAGLLHERGTDPRLGELLDAAGGLVAAGGSRLAAGGERPRAAAGLRSLRPTAAQAGAGPRPHHRGGAARLVRRAERGGLRPVPSAPRADRGAQAGRGGVRRATRASRTTR